MLDKSGMVFPQPCPLHILFSLYIIGELHRFANGMPSQCAYDIQIHCHVMAHFVFILVQSPEKKC